jgi:hypothetical protein
VNTRPFTEAHAVASVDLALLFEGEVSAKTRDHLTISFLDFEGFKLVVKEHENPKVSAFKRAVDDNADDVVEEVHIHESFVHVLQFDYRGWALTKQQMIDRLQPAVECVRSGELKLAGAGLMVRDVFVNDEPATYTATDVFAENGLMLPKSAFSAKNPWRFSLSETESLNEAGDLRSTVSIEAKERVVSKGHKAHFTEITHSQQAGNFKRSSDLDWLNKFFETGVDALHQRNKNMLFDLLTPEMIERIGLKEKNHA